MQPNLPLIPHLDPFLLEPSDWETAGVPETILDAALAATEAENLTAIGRSEDLGWFVLILESKALDVEQREEEKESIDESLQPSPDDATE